MGAQVMFEIDLDILGEISQESVLKAVRVFIDNQVGRSSEFELVENAFRYCPQTVLLTNLTAHGVAAMSVSAETRLNVFAVGSCSMISLPSMICLFVCRGKVQAYHNAFLVADH